MYAISGNLAGWELKEWGLTKTATVDGVSRTIGLQNPSSGTVAFTVGATSESDWRESPFYITHSGDVHASSGTIGGWNLVPKYWDASLLYTKNGTSNNGTGMAGAANSNFKSTSYPAFWAGYTGDYAHPYAASDNGEAWTDNTAFYVSHSGYLHSASGDIGGWKIHSNYLGTDISGAANEVSFMSQTGENVWIDDVGFTDCMLYAKGKFAVDISGKLYAHDARIIGEVTVTGGNFSESVTIGDTTMTAGDLKKLYDYAVGGTGIAIKQIEAKNGKIGGWKIDSTLLSSEDNNTYLAPNGRFLFMPQNNSYAGFLFNNSKNKYQFVIGSDCEFVFGDIVLTRDDFDKLKKLI
jgi:hypothetical protein